MNGKLAMYLLAGVFAFAPVPKLYAADPAQVRAIRDYVIRNGDHPSIEGRSTVHILSLTGDELGLKAPELQGNPGHTAINLNAKLGTDTEEDFFVGVSYLYQFGNSPNYLKIGNLFGIIDGRKSKGKNLDGIVYEVHVINFKETPGEIPGHIRIEGKVSRLNLNDDKLRTKIQQLYDEIISKLSNYINLRNREKN